MSKPIQPRLCVLRRRQVEARTGLGRSSLYALIAAGQFPAPIRLSANTVGWLEHEIDAWIAERTQASRAVML
ncbi:MAG: AlpA family phage regulatory protein [Thauera sp.]|nr:AlpA family phage regulatory protein [Thauera sp.]